MSTWILVLTVAFTTTQPAQYPLRDGVAVVRFATFAECRARISELQPRLAPVAQQLIKQSSHIASISLQCQRPVEA